MEFTTSSKPFLSVLAAAGKLIPAKSPILILQSFLIEVESGRVSVTAYDGEAGVTLTIPAQTKGEGSFCVSAKFLIDLVKSLPDVPVTVSVDELKNTLLVSTDKGRYKAAVQPGAVYPTERDKDAGDTLATLNIPSDDIVRGLSSTSFAMGADSFYPQLMGMLLDSKDGKVNFVATDTRAMAKYTFDCDCPEARAILPSKIVSILPSMLNKDAVVQVLVKKNAVVFASEGMMLQSQLVLGNYPAYERVIPASFNREAYVDRAGLQGVAKRVSVCTDATIPVLKLTFSDGCVTINGQIPDMGKEAEETLPCMYSGEDFTIGLSGKYLASALGNLPGEDVKMAMTDASHPVVFTPVTEERGSLLVLCMPMKID